MKEMRNAIAKKPVSSSKTLQWKRPAAALTPASDQCRPTIPKQGTPVSYLGARIYDDGKNKKLRCYLQASDRVDKKFAYAVIGRNEAFVKAFEAIENDPRVKRARKK